MNDATTKSAWKNCEFCSKSTEYIASAIKDKNRWDELPIQYKCAWKRICQVGFPRFGRSNIWKELCQHRSDINNAPSYIPYTASQWVETECKAYFEIKQGKNL